MRSTNGSILLVDDETDLLSLLSMRLRAAGYEVITATGGEEALALLRQHPVQLVITDLRMDGMDGLELFNAIHASLPALPVIMLTAHGSIPEAVSATRQGIFAFLTKPFDGRELLKQVEQAMQLGGVPQPANASQEDSWRADIIGRSAAMENLLALARLVADSDASVFLHGESGSGKEMLAQAIHKASLRRDKPFMAINCAAMPENLLESELFGYRKNAFTGATSDYQGLFQAAQGGTLLLDEIGDMPLSLQAKLLRVLQERQVRPLGSTQTVDVDVRIISATHRDLAIEIQNGRFREDLYYRLHVVPLELPPLAARREDIPLLANHFLRLLADKNRKQVRGFSPEAMLLLSQAAWPGNVRQLYNTVEQLVVLSPSPIIAAPLVHQALRDRPTPILPLAEAKKAFERDYLVQLLQATHGNVSQAAQLARRNRTEFYKLLEKHQLDATLFKDATE